MCFSDLASGAEKFAIGGTGGEGPGIATSGDPSVAGGPDNPSAGPGGALGGLLGGFGGMGGGGGGGGLLPGMLSGMQNQNSGGGPQRQQPPLFGPDAFFKFLQSLGIPGVPGLNFGSRTPPGAPPGTVNTRQMY